jgi:predicted ATP-dependent serine protease
MIQHMFILIDSFDNMRIDAEKLKQLRTRYKNSALISISQVTKDGKIRGSNEIAHDVDIEVIVTNGLAFTNKNLFKEKGREFQVF